MCIQYNNILHRQKTESVFLCSVGEGVYSMSRPVLTSTVRGPEAPGGGAPGQQRQLGHVRGGALPGLLGLVVSTWLRLRSVVINLTCLTHLTAALTATAFGELHQLPEVVVLLLEDGDLALEGDDEGLPGVLGSGQGLARADGGLITTGQRLHGPFTPNHIPDLLADTLESYLYCGT